MKAEDLKPYLTKFITAKLDDGSEHTGYITNPEDFDVPSDDVQVKLINGLYTENIDISRIKELYMPVREDTVSLPVINLTEGYQRPAEEEEEKKPLTFQQKMMDIKDQLVKQLSRIDGLDLLDDEPDDKGE